MPLILFKPLLSIAVSALTLVAVFTMYEAMGRDESRFGHERLKQIHRMNGFAYLVLYAVGWRESS